METNVSILICVVAGFLGVLFGWVTSGVTIRELFKTKTPLDSDFWDEEEGYTLMIDDYELWLWVCSMASIYGDRDPRYNVLRDRFFHLALENTDKQVTESSGTAANNAAPAPAAEPVQGAEAFDSASVDTAKATKGKKTVQAAETPPAQPDATAVQEDSSSK